MRDYLLDSSAQIKEKVKRFNSANPKMRKRFRAGTARVRRKIKKKEELSVQESSKVTFKKGILNLTKHTERNTYSRAHIKMLHKQFQLKRLGSQQKLARLSK